MLWFLFCFFQTRSVVILTLNQSSIAQSHRSSLFHPFIYFSSLFICIVGFFFSSPSLFLRLSLSFRFSCFLFIFLCFFRFCLCFRFRYSSVSVSVSVSVYFPFPSRYLISLKYPLTGLTSHFSQWRLFFPKNIRFPLFF